MSEPGAFRSLWFRWKSLRLPWRKKWLCGHDLTGTTYWEFRPTLSATHIMASGDDGDRFPSQSTRPRRIAQPPRSLHASDLRLPPAWIQWLRHTRQAAPTIPEQVGELARLEGLARLREREREENARRLEGVRPAARLGEGIRATEVLEEGKPGDSVVEEDVAPMKSAHDPWAQSRGTPGAAWQPQSWSPGKVQRR